MKNVRIIVSITVLAFALLALGIGVTEAGAPPVPSYGTAVVDGNSAEWDLAADFFANMCPGFDCGSKPITSKVYLRYSCPTQTMYVLDLVQPGNTLDTTGNQFVTVGSTSNKVVTNTSGNTGTPPSFQYLSGNNGWEASFTIAPGSYTMWFEATVNGTTSGSQNKLIPVEFACNTTTHTSQRAGGGGLGIPANDTATVTGSSTTPPLSGSVKFFICFLNNLVVFPDCQPGTGVQVGAVKPLVVNGVTGQATSDPFIPTAGGNYCFRSEFTPTNANHAASWETNQSTSLVSGGECFSVNTPTSVTLSDFSARTYDGRGMAILGLGAFGILMLGGLAFAFARKA